MRKILSNTWVQIYLFASSVFYVLAGIAVLVFQAYVWLRTGHWRQMSVIDAFQWIGWSWAVSPGDWFGLHTLLDWLPLSITCFVVAYLLTLLLFEDRGI